LTLNKQNLDLATVSLKKLEDMIKQDKMSEKLQKEYLDLV